MSNGHDADEIPAELPGDAAAVRANDPARIKKLDIEDELRSSYLTYAMSVIISRALPDARDGLKPSQRRILVAMNDLNLGPGGHRVKCAKISGDTSGNYHPHGEAVIYPTLVRMAQSWIMRDVLVDKQGNFGSIAGLPPAAMRYTEARLSAVASEMLDDIDRETVDFVPTYDQRSREPVVLPSRFPNLLVNGSSGIAVGMATSIPPHNLHEVADAVVKIIDDPECTVDDIMEGMPGPDFPTGGIICGREGIRQGYLTGRSTITLRAATHFETEKNTDVIVVTEIPYLETRDRLKEKLEDLVRDERIKGIARIVDFTDRKTPEWQVRVHIVLRRDADRDVVLNQLFQYSSLQVTFSIILLALVGNRPQTMPVKTLLQEFLRHRVTVIRRRTEFLLAEARKRKHTVEGLLIAQSEIDHVIATIRSASSRAAARTALQEMDMPAELVERALGDVGYRDFQLEKGVADVYRLSANQAEAIVAMQLGSLANLERETLSGEHHKLLDSIVEYRALLADEGLIRATVRQEMIDLKAKYGNKRRTAISDDEVSIVNRGDLIAEEPMAVTLSQRGYVKRTPLSIYQAQNRGGKGITGVKSDEEDDVKHLFVASTHAYLLFFTDRGRVHWQKVYDLPLQGRTSRGRALVNLLSLKDGEERVTSCLAVREFTDDQFLIMATRSGTIKKTALSSFSRPMKGGIIAIKLDEGDELIDVRIVSADDDVVMATSNGMSIRFSHKDARPMGRATRGVRGISLAKGDTVVGMVVADPQMTLLTVCEHGYGKRTPFGRGIVDEAEAAALGAAAPGEADVPGAEGPDAAGETAGDGPPVDDVTEPPTEASDEPADLEDEEAAAGYSGNQRYRRQRRGGKGLRDIRTTERNGKVIDIAAVSEDDEVMMVTVRGKIQRVRASDISEIGRNTQGVRIIRLDEDDRLVSLARIPADIAAAPPGVTESQAAAPDVPRNGTGLSDDPTEPPSAS